MVFSSKTSQHAKQHIKSISRCPIIPAHSIEENRFPPPHPHTHTSYQLQIASWLGADLVPTLPSPSWDFSGSKACYGDLEHLLLIPQSPKCWDYRFVPPYQTWMVLGIQPKSLLLHQITSPDPFRSLLSVDITSVCDE